MTRRLTSICVVCLCGLLLAIGSLNERSKADDAPLEPKETERDRWMAAKLTMSKQILEHLTSGDFEQLETSAHRMQVMNFLEQWARDQNFEKSSDYQGQLNAFEFATKELVRNAGSEDVDGALKAYVTMTESCVRCHQLIRDVD